MGHLTARSIEDVVATLIYEMVHCDNYEKGIKDCSRGGTCHNKRFKVSAKSHGLCGAHSEKCGWSHTSTSGRTA